MRFAMCIEHLIFYLLFSCILCLLRFMHSLSGAFIQQGAKDWGLFLFLLCLFAFLPSFLLSFFPFFLPSFFPSFLPSFLCQGLISDTCPIAVKRPTGPHTSLIELLEPPRKPSMHSNIRQYGVSSPYRPVMAIFVDFFSSLFRHHSRSRCPAHSECGVSSVMLSAFHAPPPPPPPPTIAHIYTWTVP